MRGEGDRMARELRDNLLGPWVWHTLELATRTFLVSAEAVFWTRRDDPAFDFGTGPGVRQGRGAGAERVDLRCFAKGAIG